MTVDDTTRTPDPKDAETPDPTEHSETPVPDERADPSEGEYQKRQALENKIKAETLNALFASYGVTTAEELRERLAQSPAAPAVKSPEDDDDDDSFDPAELHRAGEFRQQGDPVASVVIRMAKRIEKLEKRNEQLAKGVGIAFDIRDIQDPSLRARAIKHYQKNDHRLGDIQAALAEVQVADQRTEIVRLKNELAKLTKPRDPDVLNAPKTQGREIAATEAKRPMTLEKALAEANRLRAEGKDHAAMKFLEAAEIEG
jgi:hypothetical protein